MMIPCDDEKCFSCGKRYPTVYSVPDEVWEQINPTTTHGAGLLCPQCADKRARERGIILYWSCGVRKYPDNPK